MLHSENINHLQSDRFGFLFILFLVWTFVLLSRPQDIFTGLIPLRPAFTVSLIVLPFFVFKAVDWYLYPVPSTYRFTSSRQTPLYIALLCIMFIGVPFAIYRRGTFFSVTDYLMKVALFYFIFIKMVNTVRKLEIALMVGCFGTGFYATMAIMQGILKGNRLTFAKMFDPNDLAFFTLSFLPFNFLFISKENPSYQRIFSIISIVSSIFVILMSGSRGGFVAFLAVMFLLMNTTRTIKHWYKVFLIAIGFVVLSFNLATVDFSRYKTITNLGDDYNITSEWGRIAVWKEGIRFMISNPLTGVGVGCFSNALGTKRAHEGHFPMWQTAHNSLILVGAETGIIGFLLFLLMNINALKIFWNSRKQPCLENLRRIGEMTTIGFVGHFICIMFLSQTYSLYWAFYIALSAVLHRFNQCEAEFESMKFRNSPMTETSRTYDSPLPGPSL